jgi:hypothetical protein
LPFTLDANGIKERLEITAEKGFRQAKHIVMLKQSILMAPDVILYCWRKIGKFNRKWQRVPVQRGGVQEDAPRRGLATWPLQRGLPCPGPLSSSMVLQRGQRGAFVRLTDIPKLSHVAGKFGIVGRAHKTGQHAARKVLAKKISSNSHTGSEGLARLMDQSRIVSCQGLACHPNLSRITA